MGVKLCENISSALILVVLRVSSDKNFMQTGGNFVKDGHTYKMLHRQQMIQAQKANIDIKTRT